MAGRKFSLHHLLLIVAIVTFLSLMFGYLLRLNPGGQVCPDFPTCYGQLAVPENAAARLELAHRLISALGGLLTLAAGGWAVRVRASRLLVGMLAAASLLNLAQLAVGVGLVFIAQPPRFGVVDPGAGHGCSGDCLLCSRWDGFSFCISLSIRAPGTGERVWRVCFDGIRHAGQPNGCCLRLWRVPTV